MEQFYSQQWIDIGFITCMIAGCIWSIIRAARTSERVIGDWKRELQAVESSIRELIREASQQSGALDRALSRRRDELEGLLRKLNGASAAVQTAVSAAQSAVKEGVPNESWLTARPKKQRGEEELKPIPTEDVADVVSLSLADQVKRTKETPTPTVDLNDTNILEESPFEDRRPRFGRYQEEGSIAFAVAKRLLQQGQEIHVVARKLELPLADVRALDRERIEQARFEAQFSPPPPPVTLPPSPPPPPPATDADIERALSDL